MQDKRVFENESGSAKPPAGRSDIKPVDAAAIRAELDRMLNSAAFRNSKRYSALLRYLVDNALNGNGEQLKERTIGIEVFDRTPDYDTSADHIVRSAASDIRKRLAQYYQESGAESIIRIDLYPGSYVPSFRVREPQAPPPTPLEASPETGEPTPVPARRQWLLHCATFACAVGLTLGISALRSWHSTTALDRFWDPVAAQPGSVLVCVGRHIQRPDEIASSAASAGTGESAENRFSTGRGFRTSDLVTGGNAIALARIAGQLQARGKPIRVFLAASASLHDLQERSVVLIGGPNNEWTIQMLKALRFRLEGRDSPIIDTASNPPGKTWTPELDTAQGEYVRDYGLVARYVSSQTGRMIVIAAGTHVYGTMAAGEFLGDETLLSQLQALAPRGWERMNLEVILATDIVGGIGGRPTIVATHFW